MSQSDSQQTNKPRAGIGRRLFRGVVYSVGALILLILVALVAGALWLGTAHARDFVLGFATDQLNTSDTKLIITNASGSLLDTLSIEQVSYQDKARDLVLERVNVQWSPTQLFTLKLLVSAIEVDSVRLALKATDEPVQEPEPAAGLPDSLALPVQFELKRFAVDKLTVRTPGADEPLNFSNIALAARYGPAGDGSRYLIDGATVTTPWGELEQLMLSLGDQTPFPLSTNAQWQGPLAEQTLNLSLTGNGNLDRFDLDASAQAGSASINLTAAAQPLKPAPWTAAQLKLDRFNIREFAPSAPATSLGVDIGLRNLVANSPDPDPDNPASRDQIEASLALTNEAAGPLHQDKLPIRRAGLELIAAFAEDPAKASITINNIDIRLVAQPAVAQSAITGGINVDLSESIQIADQSLPAVSSQLSFTDIDLNQWLETIPPTALAGQLALTRRELEIDLAQSSAVPIEALDFPGQASSEAPSIQVRANLQRNQLLIEQMRAALNGTVLQVTGQAALKQPFEVAVKGKLENLVLDNWLTPEQQEASKLARGNLNADFSVTGPTLPPATTTVELSVFDSRVGGEALAIDTSALVSTGTQGNLDRISGLDLKLSLGKNQLSASGALGRQADELTLTGTLPNLEDFDSRLAGRFNLDGSLQGPFDALHARLQASGSRLEFGQAESSVSLRALEIDADLPLKLTPGPDEKLLLKVNADRVQSGQTSLRRARLTVDGTPDSHTYDASVRSGKWAARLGGQGKADLGEEPSWTTTIRRLDVDGDLTARLRGRPTLSVSAERIDLQDLSLSLASGRLSVDRAQVALGETPNISIIAAASNLVVSELLAAVSQAQAPPELGRLRAQAEIALQGTKVEDLSGTVTLALDEGARSDTPKLGITTGRVLTLTADQGELDGRLTLNLPSLEFSRAYTGAEIKVDGSLSLRADIGGTMQDPSWVAKITGSDLEVLQRSVGWQLNQGVLDATVTPQQLELNTLRISSGEGALAISGSAKIPTSAGGNNQKQALFNGRFTIRPDEFVVPIGPGQRIAISGETLLSGDASGIDLTGNLRVDEGVIEVQGSGAPSAPSDLVFEDAKPDETAASSKQSAAQEAGGPSIRADLSIDTGQNLRVVGSGIRARLVGKLNLGGVLPDSPRLTGRVDVSDGSYRAYGQALDIKRGIVRFNGPADNPNLDILAIRPNLPVEVGVSVNGTAAVPTIELVSTPELSDAEKLSWLVLGTELDSAAGAAQSLALQQAAKSLIGVNNSDEQGGIAERLGFDSLGLGYASETDPEQGVTDSGAPTGLPGATNSSDSVSAEEVVTVGRQLSSKVRISYEQGLRGIQNLLRIQYDVSKRLALRAQTGSDNAIDLLYFFSFD